MEKILHIGYFADGQWGQNAFDRIIQDETLCVDFIMVRYDVKDPVLIQKAKEHGIDLLLSPNINSDEFYQILQRYQIDLYVSMSFNQIFHERVRQLPSLGVINCHAGKLPFYRGRNILNWALINDEKEFGITVHFVDDGIDTGDIIIQKTYPITDMDDYGTLLQVAYRECPKLLYKAIKQIQTHSLNRIRQDTIAQAGLYCGARHEGDEIINWNQTSREVFNFVRAVTRPAPGATTFNVDQKIIIWKAQEIHGAPCYKGIPGQVLVKTTDKILIKTADSYINILEYEGKLKTGDRLR